MPRSAQAPSRHTPQNNDAVQPGQRRRRRDPAADRQPPSPAARPGKGQQGTIRLYDDRVNILNNTIATNGSTPRGRRHRTRRLDERGGGQQHGRAQHHDRDGDDERAGESAPAGLWTSRQQFLLQAELGQALRRGAGLPNLSPGCFSTNRLPPPTARAGGHRAAASGAAGISKDGDASTINLWDIGLADNLCNGSGNARRCLSPAPTTSSTPPAQQHPEHRSTSPTNLDRLEPSTSSTTPIGSRSTPCPWRGYPQFVGAVLVAVRPFPSARWATTTSRAGTNSPVDNSRGVGQHGHRQSQSHPRRPRRSTSTDPDTPAERRLRHRLRQAPSRKAT